jgi:hypothetical protein
MSQPLPTDLEGTSEHPAGQIWVDDEDEFLEHQVAYGYPAEVIEAARASCDRVFAAVAAGAAPYDGTHRRWLEELTRISGSV